MSSKRMLVDATHPEETRVVVTSGNRLEEFDFESANRRQLRGNIYLAKVTRVEPSLQAAFVDYGGNRHGFLAFSEIHPDYYQIPLADREALLRDQAEDNEKTAEADDIAARGIAGEAQQFEQPAESDDGQAVEVHEDAEEAEPAETGGESAEPGESHDRAAPNGQDKVEDLGGDEAIQPVPRRSHRKRARVYKIQEVVKRRQVLLVQVVKEERGNKGAALTTYLSLAGRYSVLMPNTARGGGISRKITLAADRKRLKEIAGELEVPADMGVILRTAGASRNKAEVKRDFEYLLRLWENVRELTLASSAPMLVYEEGSLIKRAIRDLYSKDISEVVIAGDEAYKESKEFMKMIMPSHARHVKAYKEDQPIFSRYNVESQLDAMFSPRVTLPSGGYIVMNPTEALVSIDVNSGKSTREHNIEDTALQTNSEAAEEVARQLRLRDLAGLIVVDFIDMEEKRNNRTVERRLKDALKNDRARIQIGRISHFGLLEMSRQRIRFGVLESSTRSCPHCEGSGLIRSVESRSLAVMRAIEDQVRKRPGQSVTVHVPTEVALYVLNAKRASLAELEMKHRLSIAISADAGLGPNQYSIERRDAGPVSDTHAHVRVDSAPMEAPQDLPVDESEPADAAEEEAQDIVAAEP
ncbi:MAG: ribonuclease E/G, partial [Cucumibacter sp.]